MTISGLASLRIKYISDKVVHKIKTHVLCSLTLSENRAVYKKMWNKYCRVGQFTDDSMAHTHCMLHT